MEEKLYSNEQLNTKQYKCPNCGGTSVFSPKEQKLKCEYCGTIFDIENQKQAYEHKIDELLQNDKKWTEAKVVKCNSCGGKQIVNNNEISTICSFCGATNYHLLKFGQRKKFLPHQVLKRAYFQKT